jgi:polyhydroxyalkanoate synthesis regulator phasin
MNPDTLSQTLQKGFHVTLGATASLIEAIQDPQGSSQKFSALGGDVNRLTEELEVKGVTTEQEARQFVDGIFSQIPGPFSTSHASSQPPTVNTVATPVADVAVQTDLEVLTQELMAIRQEIEALKGQPKQGG